MIRKTKTGRWRVDIKPGGRTGPRYRKTFDTKGEALRWEAYARTRSVQEPWNRTPSDKRYLSDLLEEWHKHYGHALKTGSHRRRVLECLIDTMGDPLARDFGADAFTAYRSIGTKSASTYNNELAYLRAMFNELSRVERWAERNPLATVRQLPTQEHELSWLTPEQIPALLEECDSGRNPDTGKVARVCLATGARWSEAEQINRQQVLQDRIRFTDTKNGSIRTVPIAPEIHALFSLSDGRQFSNCYSAFRKAVERSGIELPRGQLSHVLRHTFASNFMQKGGNLLVLQRILGHHSITVTQRYAHFAPEHLNDAVLLNPLSKKF